MPSSRSSGRARPAAIPATLAAAADACMSGPGCTPSSRNIRAAGGAEVLVGPGEHRPRAAARRVSAASSTSSRSCAARSSPTSAGQRTGRPGGAGGGDCQRERQPGAQAGQLGDRVGARHRPEFGPQRGGKQLLRLRPG